MVLFLDDLRNPSDVPTYFNYERDMYVNVTPHVVRNFDEFKEFVDNNFNEITHISFDHDLGDDHYIDKKYWGDYEKSKAIQDVGFSVEKNGVDCAKYFINKYLTLTNEKPLTDVFINIHSANPVGADNIASIFNSYIKLFGGNTKNIEVYKQEINGVRLNGIKEKGRCNSGGCLGEVINYKCNICGRD